MLPAPAQPENPQDIAVGGRHLAFAAWQQFGHDPIRIAGLPGTLSFRAADDCGQLALGFAPAGAQFQCAAIARFGQFGATCELVEMPDLKREVGVVRHFAEGSFILSFRSSEVTSFLEHMPALYAQPRRAWVELQSFLIKGGGRGILPGVSGGISASGQSSREACVGHSRELAQKRADCGPHECDQPHDLRLVDQSERDNPGSAVARQSSDRLWHGRPAAR